MSVCLFVWDSNIRNGRVAVVVAASLSDGWLMRLIGRTGGESIFP